MKKVLVAALVLSFIMVSLPVFAGEKGASVNAFEHASDESVFNRVSDWFATVGKSDAEKQQILTERKAKRAAKRVEQEAKKAQKESEKKAKSAEKKLKESQKDIKKSLGIK